MTFLTGGFLAGLALTGVPVLIHLIIRRRRKLVRWGAMQFLMGTPPRFRQRLLKLNELLVLLLRVLAITALVLAFAQPLVLSGILSRRAGEHVFIIDASLSTARVTADTGTAFAAEIEAAEKALAALGEHETARILMATDAPRWLTPAPLELTPGNREALRSMLQGVQPTDGGSDLVMAVAEALQIPPAPDRNARRLVIFSDATDRPWHAADVTRWRAIEKAAAAAQVPTSIEVVPAAPPNPEEFANLAINRLTVDHDTVAVGDAVLMTAEIRNASRIASAATEIIWQLDGKEAGRMPLPPLNAGVSTTVEFPLPSGDAGSHIARVSLAAKDDLPADSAAAVAIRTLDEIPVLVVDGGRRANSDDVPESGFLLAALGRLPGDRERSKVGAAFQPKVIGAGELSNVRLDPFLCVILADVEKIEQADAARLATHVAKGGGLWIALGDRTKPEQFNEVFSSSATGLSPMQLGPLIGEVPETAPGWRVLPPGEPHPATILLRDSKQLDIDKARVRRHHTVLAPIPTSLGVLLKLETQAPLVIEHTFGKGRVFVQMAPLERTWNNLPILQSYVPIVREFLWRLVDGRVSRRNLAPGETLRFAADAKNEPSFQVKLPDGQTFSGSADEGQVRFAGTFLPGIYQVERRNEAPELFGVPRPAAESDLTPLSDETRQTVGKHGVAFGDAASSSDGGGTTARGRKSITPVLLGCAIAFFVLEALLTWLFARQRMVHHGAVVLTPVTMR